MLIDTLTRELRFPLLKKVSSSFLFHLQDILHYRLTGLSIDWCKQPENGLPKPDLVFLLTLTAEEMKNRPGFGSERYENLSFQERVAAAYNELTDETWVTVDASSTIEGVHNDLLNRVVETVSLVGKKPLGTLDFNKKSSQKNGNMH